MIKNFIKRYYPYVKDHKLYFFLSFIGILLSSASQGGMAYIIKPIINDVFINKNESLLYVICVIVITIFLAKGIGDYIQNYFMNFIGLNTVRLIRNKMLDHLLTLDMQFFNKKRSGELISRITYDIMLIRSAVSTYLASLIKDIFTAIFLIGITIYQSALLALIGFVAIPLSIFPLFFIVKKLKELSYKSQEKNSDITSKLSEIFNNVEIIKASNGEKIESSYFEKDNLSFFKTSIKSTRISGFTSPIMELLTAIGIVTIILIGGKRVIDDHLSTGEFFSFITALILLYAPIKRIISNFNGIQEALVAGERIGNILDTKPNISDGNEFLNSNIESISFKNVWLKYEDIYNLKNINLEFNKHTITAIVGKSGGGKSSIINLILRLYDPTQGTIEINGKNLKNLTQREIRDKIAIVTQKIFIFNDTIANNVAYGKEVNEEKIKAALKKARIYEFVETMPNGINTMLDEFGSNLSGGQRQRIAIARAFYKDAQILILDEATSALDEKTEEELRNTLFNFAQEKDKILIIIAHRPSTISLANRIVEVKDGEIVSISNKTINN